MNSKFNNEKVIVEEMYSEFENFIETNMDIVEDQLGFESQLFTEPQYYLPKFY